MKTHALWFCLAALTVIAADPPKPEVKYASWDGHESVAEYGQRVHLAPALTLELGGGIKWEGVLIPAGTFVMGSPVGEAKTEQEAAMEKQHQVTLTRPFYLGKLELTQAQYQQVMGDNPSLTKGDELPVHNVAWQNAQDFCEKLSQQTGRAVQLPTEAQWEYACRAGTTTAYYNGNDFAGLDAIAWYGANSDHKLHPGGQKLPNAWGLFDMLGNIREFVRDLYGTAAPVDAVDPTGPTEGDPKNHVVRGAAFTANAAVALNCRAAVHRPTEALAITGFRIMVAVP